MIYRICFRHQFQSLIRRKREKKLSFFVKYSHFLQTSENLRIRKEDNSAAWHKQRHEIKGKWSMTSSILPYLAAIIFYCWTCLTLDTSAKHSCACWSPTPLWIKNVSITLSDLYRFATVLLSQGLFSQPRPLKPSWLISKYQVLCVCVSHLILSRGANQMLCRGVCQLPPSALWKAQQGARRSF